jgi:hypothetical protein
MAVGFYRHHDFVPVREARHRLAMKVATARGPFGATEVGAAGASAPT